MGIDMVNNNEDHTKERFQVNSSHCVWRQIERIARQRVICVVAMAVLSFGGSWLWSLPRGIPVPYNIDEFSYLLAADTFAHGRVTNSTHPMWEFFDTFHVLQRPTYMSKYCPAQGLFLAGGQVLFGHPIYGVWLSAGLMCAAICWMLYGWLAPKWALVGGIVAVLQFGVFTYWSQSYWGGAVAGIGGALVFGALPRIIKYQNLKNVLWLGLGIAVLAISRPLEGFLVCIPLGCLVLSWKIRWDKLFLSRSRFIKNIILPLGLVLSLIVISIGMYNKKITGHAAVYPQIYYDHTYSAVPLFIWQPLRPPVHFQNKALEDYEKLRKLVYYTDKRTYKGFIKDMQMDSFVLSAFYLGYPLIIPAVFMLTCLLGRWQYFLRVVLALFILLCACASMTCNAKPHYFSPLTCLVVLFMTIGLRALFRLRFRQKRIGEALVIFFIILQLLLNVSLTPRLPVVKSLAMTASSSQIILPGSFTREELKNILMKRGGKFLVIVRYPLWHSYTREWVFNDADIDRSPVVWARDMGVTGNVKLFNYFKDRQVLLVNIIWEVRGLNSLTVFNRQ